MKNIKPIVDNEIPYCVDLIKRSFLTIANQYGITEENAPRFIVFAINEERLYM